MPSDTAQCPQCAREIKPTARVCPYCLARLEVTRLGYCTRCHDIVEADDQDRCRRCGAELVDPQLRRASVGQEDLVPVPELPEPATPSPAAQAPQSALPAAPEAAADSVVAPQAAPAPAVLAPLPPPPPGLAAPATRRVGARVIAWIAGIVLVALVSLAFAFVAMPKIPRAQSRDTDRHNPTAQLTADRAACLPGAEFVADVSVPDGTRLEPGAPFTKVWRLRAVGCAWPEGTQCVFVSGERLEAPAAVGAPAAAPGETADISIPMVAPSAPGTYKGTWRLQTAEGILFGPLFYVVITVGEPTPDP